MFNIFKNTSNRKKLNLTDDMVVGFLNGSYEKDLYSEILKNTGLKGKKVKDKQLQGIRAIEVSYNTNDVEIYFAKQYQEGQRMYKHEYGLKPFLWSKNPNNSNLFAYNIIELTPNEVSDTHVTLPRDVNEARLKNQNIIPSEIDGDNVRVLKTIDDGLHTKYYVRYKVKSVQESEQILNAKAELYGISTEKQITSFDNSTIGRMDSGFKYKFSIKNHDGNSAYSDNPYFCDKRITGSFNNLLTFFKEAGISARGTKYLDDIKLKSYIKTLSNEDLVKFYFGIYRWRKEFNPFTADSVNWDGVINIYKENYPKLAFKINKEYINKDIEKDYVKFLDRIHTMKLFSKDIFNIKLDDDKLINYLVDCYTFDGNSSQKELVDYFNSIGVDFYRILEAQLFYVTPREQYMIQTGRRLFKGIENYEDLDILTFDIETKAQLKHSNMESAALFPIFGRVFQIGIGDNKGYTEVLHAKQEHEERDILKRIYEIIAEKDPDIILTYNGEGFDFPFMEKRLEILGCIAEEKRSKKGTSAQYIRNIMASYYHDYEKGKYIYPFYSRNEHAIVKIGDSTEHYTQTSMIGRTNCDVMFSVKKAAAIDTSIPNAKLKDNIIHANLASPNRVYIQGDKIGFTESDKRPYYYNSNTGEYFVSTKSIEFSNENIITKKDFDSLLIREGADGRKFYKNSKLLYLYGDYGVDTCDIQDCINVFPIKLHKDGVPFLDIVFEDIKEFIDENFKLFYKKAFTYDGIVCPTSKINGKNHNKILYPLDNVNTKRTFEYLKAKFAEIRPLFNDVKLLYDKLSTEELISTSDNDNNRLNQDKRYNFNVSDVENWNDFTKVSGSLIVEKYLEGDIDEPILLEMLYSQATFEISKWLPTSYQKISTMGNANVWKLILSTWSYLNCIAIPDYEPSLKFTGGLVGMVESGYHEEGVKLDYSSLYPAEFLAHVQSPDIDITGIYKMLVKYGLETRLLYKNLKNKSKNLGEIAKALYYDKKQLPLKLLINVFYGMLGAPKVSPFSHINSAWHITCSGRQHMRHMIHYFKPLGLKIIYFHTDGANFVLPKDIENYTYIGQGINWLVVKDKIYKGVEAHVAEYNDKFMVGRMGLDIDEYFISCINFAKANFSYLKESYGKKKISHVGGTLINKRQSEYIKSYLDKNLMQLFLGDGVDYVESYYDYIKKINNGDIVAGEICSKARVKKSIPDYQKHIKDGGNSQAHMELAIMYNLDVGVGDWINYINIGNDLKSKGDLVSDINNIGYFSFGTKEKRDAFAKILKGKLDDKISVSKLIKEYRIYGEDLEGLLKEEKPSESHIANLRNDGYFVFKSNFVEINDPSAKAKKMKISKDVFLDDINEIDEIKLKLSKKELSKKPVQFLIEIIFSTRYLNVELVNIDEMDAKIPYNKDKYLEKFNKAISPLWIVFNPEIRPKIPTPNKKKFTGEDYDRNANQRGWFLEEELKLTSGFPLKGKENNQQDLHELLKVTQEEMELWRLLKLSPNNSIDNARLDWDSDYFIDKNWNISTKKIENYEKIKGDILAESLASKITLDVNNTPYKFIN